MIAVKVTTAQPSSRWYTGSGIYRDVTLTVTDPVHVDYNGMYVTTPTLEEDLKSGKAKVSVEANIVNGTQESKEATVTEQILDADGKVVAEKSAVQTLGEEKAKVTQELEVENPHLWSTDDPYLYTAKTQITVDGTVVDEYETTFGMRYLTFTTDKGFYLNGKYTKLNGMCLHHDFGALGAAANERAVERQLQQIKAMGANAVRTSHNPASKVFIEKCNELGLMKVLKMLSQQKEKEDLPTDLPETHMQQKESKSVVEDIMEYIQKHYYENINVSELAEMYYLNDTYLSTLFKEKTGWTLKSYLESVRIEKAKSMLKSRDYTIAYVASAVGYTDPNYFSKVFKRYTDLTPRQFREIF